VEEKWVREGRKMRGNSIATCEEIGRERDISDSETTLEVVCSTIHFYFLLDTFPLLILNF
jgi:hypothetical protein